MFILFCVLNLFNKAIWMFVEFMDAIWIILSKIGMELPYLMRCSSCLTMTWGRNDGKKLLVASLWQLMLNSSIIFLWAPISANFVCSLEKSVHERVFYKKTKNKQARNTGFVAYRKIGFWNTHKEKTFSISLLLFSPPFLNFLYSVFKICMFFF